MNELIVKIVGDYFSSWQPIDESLQLYFHGYLDFTLDKLGHTYAGLVGLKAFDK